MPPTYRHPVNRQFEAELTASGLGLQRSSRPRLTGQWVTGEDGKLTCHWNVQAQ